MYVSTTTRPLLISTAFTFLLYKLLAFISLQLEQLLEKHPKFARRTSADTQFLSTNTELECQVRIPLSNLRRRSFTCDALFYHDEYIVTPVNYVFVEKKNSFSALKISTGRSYLRFYLVLEERNSCLDRQTCELLSFLFLKIPKNFISLKVFFENTVDYK